MTIAENYRAIRARVSEACARSGRGPGSVRIIGVTKTVPVDRIMEGVGAGIVLLGENYVQEAERKVDALAGLALSWHFIGHLQSNKARSVVSWADCIHTVDRESLAVEIDRQAQKLGRVVPVLLQVNVGDEESKSGVHPDGLEALYKTVIPLDGLSVQGLMTLPPYHEDQELVRPYFRMLKSLLDRLKQVSPWPDMLCELSMGMSHDFEAAVEEGATMVRIGTALYGSRPLKTA